MNWFEAVVQCNAKCLYQDVKEAMNVAAKASAIAVTRKGAAPSIPTWEELEQFY